MWLRLEALKASVRLKVTINVRLAKEAMGGALVQGTRWVCGPGRGVSGAARGRGVGGSGRCLCREERGCIATSFAGSGPPGAQGKPVPLSSHMYNHDVYGCALAVQVQPA